MLPQPLIMVLSSGGQGGGGFFDFKYQAYLIVAQRQNEESEGSDVQPGRWSSFS